MAYEGAVRSFQAPGTDGEFEVLTGHVPMLTSLRPGILTIRDTESRHIYAVSGGFVEVLRHQATVLAEAVERADEIDLDRAQQAEARARQRLESGGQKLDIDRAKASLDRALNRIKVSHLFSG
jgi:F-type H+-transporting ATPase subunit epsilon